MIQRYWRFLLAALIVLALVLGFWLWNRPAPQPVLEHLTLENGTALIHVSPGTQPKARVGLAALADEGLTDKQLLALSQDGNAEVVQVTLPKDDCALQDKTLTAALTKLDGPATLVGGVGPGATLAWRWLAGQNDDNAKAVSVGFSLDPPACVDNVPKSAAHGHWLVAWNDGPDDAAATLVRDQPNAENSISDYDVHLPQLFNSQLRQQLVQDDQSGGLKIPVVEVPAGTTTDTVTLFLSGDGGWRDLDRDVAGEMAKKGYPVVGIDTLRYYWEHKTPEQTALDLAELMDHYRQKWGTKRFVLMGYSFGADVLPAIYNRLAPDEQKRVDSIVLLAFARTGSFEIQVEGWLGTAGKEAPTGPEMAKLPPEKVLCVYGAEETAESGCTETTAVGEKLMLPGGHHFDENYPALAKRMTDAIDKRRGTGPKA
ncbi:AcvB/VirJ family lysyl-phosphatidylglycerol hydrolase [Pseudomonas sp. CCI3.2]|uniref:virulence factor family protein n=1 Tax=unclassified Pseudomonas TaxID=196821 RepID=UPI002AC89B4C|nr:MULTISPECIES: AcvB/VirJ family lysyl-phosphatidylglycerol hydrolase [unclassified Pseudomonas]MEB0080282.1 AcvB/VirJ family lysyl-phosphatidylglycerol hydrolase [Pseudomonas sp. MH10out]MEB0089940.1 AcvB/VirJ family lysyl-phosphatidylglycerol hydrolase [Pseudomonas sp. CCI4.2]MEB0104523.1 AcvB/VirJ family lysyl-phosphatidylglycerol hydrolase [Pseudomonas sp. CCI3.2]MEB0133491.1 AcvB/VirJ family lysyl-phosphatidylglycerol hydrolase [Pseudomonas sp. CCI2.4]MEB0158919.1 AcvB/VirJ family lysyl-